MKLPRRLLLALGVGSVLLVRAASFAEDTSSSQPPAATQLWTHRITGLFAPARADLLRAAISQIPGVTLVRLDFLHAEAVLSYDPDTAFHQTGAAQVLERLQNAVANATHHTLGVAPLDPTPHDQLTHLEIPIYGIDCQACALAVYETIYQVDGVTAATVDFRQNLLTAEIDPNRTDRDTLAAALKKRGVELEKPKGDPNKTP